MCEMSKAPPARRTARCSSTMLEYWTGISQPPNSMSLPPSLWCAEKSGVRFSDMRRNLQCAVIRKRSLLTPLLEPQLLLRQSHFAQHELLGAFDECVGAARIKNRVRAVITSDFSHPIRRDASAPSRPWIALGQPRA